MKMDTPPPVIPVPLNLGTYQGILQGLNKNEGEDLPPKSLVEGSFNLEWSQRILGIKSDETERLSKIFFLHRKAIEAEIIGAFAKADFFWFKLHQKIQKINFENLEAFPSGNPKDYFLRDVLMHTHQKFLLNLIRFNEPKEGHSDEIKKNFGNQENIQERIRFHYSKLEELALSNTDIENTELVFHWLVPFKVKYIIQNDIESTLEFLSDYQEKDISLRLNEEILDISLQFFHSTFKNESSSNPKHILAFIKFFENQKKINLPIQLFKNELAELYARLSELQSNDWKLSNALLFIQKAMVHNPKNSEYQNDWDNLYQKMIHLQDQIKAIVSKDLGHLVKGDSIIHLVNEAHIGLGLVNKYLSNKKVLEFTQKTNEETQINDFLPNGAITLNDVELINTHPLIPYQDNFKHKSEIPFDHWLFSRKNIPTKLILAASVIIGFLTLSVFITQGLRKDRRDLAYEKILAFHQNSAGIDSITIEIQTFLDNPPALGKDSRGEDLMDIFEQEFSTWLLSTEDTTIQNIEDYRSIYEHLNNTY